MYRYDKSGDFNGDGMVCVCGGGVIDCCLESFPNCIFLFACLHGIHIHHKVPPLQSLSSLLLNRGKLELYELYWKRYRLICPY